MDTYHDVINLLLAVPVHFRDVWQPRGAVVSVVNVVESRAIDGGRRVYQQIQLGKRNYALPRVGQSTASVRVCTCVLECTSFETHVFAGGMQVRRGKCGDARMPVYFSITSKRIRAQTFPHAPDGLQLQALCYSNYVKP